jgi:hypothetical protein
MLADLGAAQPRTPMGTGFRGNPGTQVAPEAAVCAQRKS